MGEAYVCARSVKQHWQRTLLSSAPVAMVAPSGEKAAVATSCACPCTPLRHQFAVAPMKAPITPETLLNRNICPAPCLPDTTLWPLSQSYRRHPGADTSPSMLCCRQASWTGYGMVLIPHSQDRQGQTATGSELLTLRVALGAPLPDQELAQRSTAQQLRLLSQKTPTGWHSVRRLLRACRGCQALGVSRGSDCSYLLAQHVALAAPLPDQQLAQRGAAERQPVAARAECRRRDPLARHAQRVHRRKCGQLRGACIWTHQLFTDSEASCATCMQ